MEQVHAPVKGKSSGKATDATADNNDAMGFLLHVSFLVYSPSPSPFIKDFLWPAKRRSNEKSLARRKVVLVHMYISFDF